PAEVAGADTVEGAVGARIHATHRAGGVDFTADIVELVEQRPTIADAITGDAIGESEVAEAGAVRREGPVRDAEEARLAADRLAAEADEGREVVVVAAKPADHRADRRMVLDAVGVF